MTIQHRLLHEFDTLYEPIVGAGEDYDGHKPVETPSSLVDRTKRLKLEYDELKKDLAEEINQVQRRIIDPAQDAKNSLTTAKKTVRRREDKKLDYETYQARVDALGKKSRLSDRERGQLTKAQADLAASTEAYNAADEGLKRYLPPLLNAVWSLQPYILAAQIQIQNSLLAHYYTMLHNYCTDENFPSPSPPMDEVLRLWEEAFKPIQKEFEMHPMIAHGKALRKSLSHDDKNPPYTNGARRPSGQAIRVPSMSPGRTLPPASPATMPSETNGHTIIRPKMGSETSSSSLLSPITPLESTVASAASTPLHSLATGHAPAGPRMDYFSRDRQPSGPSHNSMASPSTVSVASPYSSATSTITIKRKPPPPPPRTPSEQFQFVVALYDFGGQGDGDLAFKEGDKIRVVKKTESTDDWWQGELKGVKGMFPANYVQV